MLLLGLIEFKKKNNIDKYSKNIKNKACVKKSIAMTTILNFMNLCKIPFSNEELRIPRTPKTLRTLRTLRTQMDLVDLEMATPTATASPKNHSQRSINQSISPLMFEFTAAGAEAGTKRSRNNSTKHKNKTKTSNQRSPISIEIVINETMNDCFHDVIDVMTNDVNINTNINIMKTNNHLIKTKKIMNETYKDFKNSIMLKITNQIEKLIKNFQLNKNTLMIMFNFDVINSKLNKIIKKIEKSEIQFVKISN